MKQCIIVTGGSQGIGRAIIEKLSSPNTILYNLSRDPSRGQAVSHELGCEFIPCDVTEYEEVEAAISQILEHTGAVHAVVNNAGLWAQGPLTAADPTYMREVLLTNTLGVLNVCKAVIPTMKAAGSGTIVNISSTAGLRTKPERSVYNASKWGVTALSHSLEEELASFGIRVTAIYPYTVDTDLFKTAGHPKAIAHALKPSDVAGAVEYVLGLAPGVCIPDLVIKHL